MISTLTTATDALQTVESIQIASKDLRDSRSVFVEMALLMFKTIDMLVTASLQKNVMMETFSTEMDAQMTVNQKQDGTAMARMTAIRSVETDWLLEMRPVIQER